MANWKGTTVPNSGVVESVYFNTNLSVDEVVSIIENCGYDFSNLTSYMVLLSQTQEKAIMIMGENPSYACVIYVGDSYVFAHNMVEYGFAEGWNFETISNPYEVGGEVLPTYQEESGETFEMGLYNDKLSSLFSITPFTQSEDKNILMHPRNADGTANNEVNLYPRTKIGNLLTSNGSKFTMPNVVYKQGGGTVVPNTGNVEKVYINTSLSVEEVVNIVKNANLETSAEFEFLYPLLYVNDSLCLLVQYANIDGADIVGIISGFGAGGAQYLFCNNPDMLGVSFEGWLNGFDGISEINSEVLSIMNDLEVGTKNDKLSSLFSITPFTSGGLFETNKDGTPNTDKPIQIGITEERVNELIDLKITGWLGGES